MVRALVLSVFVTVCTAASFGEDLLIPYDAFPSNKLAKKVKKVVDRCTFNRRLNENRFKTTSKVLNYLLDRMAFTSAIMRHLELEKYVITRRDDGVMLYDDKAGMTGVFQPAYVTPAKRIFYGDGFFDIGFLGKIRGESVLVMDYCQKEPDVMANTVTVFIRVRGLLGPLCKLASPILNGMIGKKSATLLNASAKLSEQLASDPEGVYEEIIDCDDITPGDLSDFRAEFLETAELLETADLLETVESLE